MAWTFLVIREAALEYELRVSLPPLTDTALNYSLVCFSLDPIAPTLVVDHHGRLVCLDDILLVL